MHVTAETGMQEAVLGTYRESDLDEIYEDAFFPADGSEEWKGYHSCSKGWNAPSQHIL